MGKKTVGRKRKGKTQNDALMLTDTEDEDIPLAEAFSIKKKKTEGTSTDQAIDEGHVKEATAEPVEVQAGDDQAKETPTSKGKRRKQKAKEFWTLLKQSKIQSQQRKLLNQRKQKVQRRKREA